MDVESLWAVTKERLLEIKREAEARVQEVMRQFERDLRAQGNQEKKQSARKRQVRTTARSRLNAGCAV